MTFLFTKNIQNVSRRQEYQSLVEDFEDYDTEDVQNIRVKDENCKKKRCSSVNKLFALVFISLGILLVFAIILFTSLDASTPFKINERNLCIGRNCHRVHKVNEDCYYGNVTLPKRLDRLKTLLDSLKVLEENKTVLRLVPTSLKVRAANRELEKFSAELEIFNSLPMDHRERLIVNTLVNNRLAFQAFKENLEVIRKVNKFDIDLSRVLTRAVACKS